MWLDREEGPGHCLNELSFSMFLKTTCGWNEKTQSNKAGTYPCYRQGWGLAPFSTPLCHLKCKKICLNLCGTFKDLCCLIRLARSLFHEIRLADPIPCFLIPQSTYSPQLWNSGLRIRGQRSDEQSEIDWGGGRPSSS